MSTMSTHDTNINTNMASPRAIHERQTSFNIMSFTSKASRFLEILGLVGPVADYLPAMQCVLSGPLLMTTFNGRVIPFK